jgi:hypothetical protein
VGEVSGYSQTIDLNYPDSHMIFIGWVRYCLGRKTYAVSECCDWLRANWANIHPNTQAVILRDIKEEIELDDRTIEMTQEREAQGQESTLYRRWDDCDRDEWESLINFLSR